MHPAARLELKQLVETYAVRTRELAESIAVLGGYVAAERKVNEIMTEVKKRHTRVDQAAANLFTFVWPQAEEPSKD